MPSCPDHPEATLIARPQGWYCLECQDTMFSYDAVPRPPDDGPPAAPADEGLPFPVAYPLAFVDNAALLPSERVDNLIFTSYQAMRVTALLLLADYLDCDVASPRLSGAIRGLRMPHWGEWTTLCDQLCKFWSGDFPESLPRRPSRFASLVTGWRAANAPKAPTRGPWAVLLISERRSMSPGRRSTTPSKQGCGKRQFADNLLRFR